MDKQMNTHQPNLEEEKQALPAAKYEQKEEWVQTYIEQFGKEPSFFDV